MGTLTNGYNKGVAFYKIFINEKLKEKDNCSPSCLLPAYLPLFNLADGHTFNQNSSDVSFLCYKSFSRVNVMPRRLKELR